MVLLQRAIRRLYLQKHLQLTEMLECFMDQTMHMMKTLTFVRR